MNVQLHLGFKQKKGPCRELVEEYRKRIRKYRTIDIFESSSNEVVEKKTSGSAWRIECTASGEPWSTEHVSRMWREQEGKGTSIVQLLVGGADGWPGASKAQARWAFGQITMPHALAAAVLAEQVYRTLTILAGHPYHEGHK